MEGREGREKIWRGEMEVRRGRDGERDGGREGKWEGGERGHDSLRLTSFRSVLSSLGPALS